LPLAGDAPWLVGDQAAEALRLAEGMDAVAIGPGLGRRPETREFLRAVARGVRAPLLIDADGLRLLAENLDDLDARPGPTVLTPHPGEAAALLGASIEAVEADRLNAMAPLAARRRCVVALKGAKTIVTAPDGQRWINPSGNTGLAKGGSGDVLTGLVAGLLAQGMAPEAAARVGVFLHGLAADLAAEKLGVRAMLPSDVIEFLGAAFLKLDRL
jgi:NAD(P)H-hydrate epimerase